MIELIKIDETIKLDIRYATNDNFIGRPVYSEPRAFLQPLATEGVVRVHRELYDLGFGVVIYDCYRPWTITKLFWESVSIEDRIFVADPSQGSKHNRGCAVDLSIFDLNTGKAVPMPSGYDEFTQRASPDYQGGTVEERQNRDKLRKLMERNGFIVNPNEWWHFDLMGWEQYPIYDLSFDEISEART